MRSDAAARGESHAMQCPFQPGVHCREEKGMMIPLLELSDTRDDKYITQKFLTLRLLALLLISACAWLCCPAERIFVQLWVEQAKSN